jgi:hypothetical protein
MKHQCKGCGFHILSQSGLCTRCAWSESLVGEKRERFFAGLGLPVRRSSTRTADKAPPADSTSTATDGDSSV